MSQSDCRDHELISGVAPGSTGRGQVATKYHIDLQNKRSSFLIIYLIKVKGILFLFDFYFNLVSGPVSSRFHDFTIVDKV